MRKTMVGLVAAAMAAGSVLIAAPAQAGPGDPVGCFQPPSPPPGGSPQTIVTVNGFDVTVNPNGDVNPDSTLDYAFAVANTPYWYVWCVEGDVLDPAFCPVGHAWNSNYVYQDESGAIHVGGNELVADMSSCI